MCPRALLNRLAPPTYEDLKNIIFKGEMNKIDDLI